MVEFILDFPEGYRAREVLAFWSRDPIGVGEKVGPHSLDKVVLIDGSPAMLEIRFAPGCAICRTEASDVPAASHLIARMLGLHSDSDEFERQFSGDPLLGATIRSQRGLRIPLTPDPWEALAWAIMGQQISLRMAVMLRRSLITAVGELHPSGLRAHPSAQAVAALEVAALRELKFSSSKAEYLIAAARAVVGGQLPLERMHEIPIAEAAKLAAAVRGIGPWTMQYFFLRGLGLPDCLPAGDAGLAQGLEKLCGTRPREAAIRDMMARFSPWRSLATCHIWATLPVKAPHPNAA